MVDCVKLPQLSEKATVGNVLPHTAPELNPLAPVVAPVVQAPRLKAVRPEIKMLMMKILGELISGEDLSKKLSCYSIWIVLRLTVWIW